MEKVDCITKARESYSARSVKKLTLAIDMATEKHAGQTRKSGEPYIIHPLSVAYLLMEWQMDIDTVLAGVLHDTVEDTDTSLEEIEAHFGREVAFLVDGVTKVSQSRAGMRNLESYLPHTKDNLSKLLIAVGQDVRVIIIKLADRLHNMRTLQHMSREKQKKIARETLEVFAPLADRLNMGRVRVELEELSFRYLNPEEFDATRTVMQTRIRKRHKKLDRVRKKVQDHFEKESIEFTMDGRVKSVYSYYKKLDRVQDPDLIYDLVALRIIVPDIDTCYLVLSELHGLYEPDVARIKDYIAKPKRNGYQSLHTTVLTSSGSPVEFQIRTTDMHHYAERGLAASFYYNESKMSDAYRKKTIAAMPANLEWIHDLQKAAEAAKAGQAFDVNKFRMNLFSDRIFVYSPKGDIYDLPVGAFPLDYAYRVHSDIAAQASGFKINDVMKPFSTILQHGDTIEVLTSKSAKPKPEWKQYIITHHGREKLRAQLSRRGSMLEHIAGAATQLQQKIRKK